MTQLTPPSTMSKNSYTLWSPMDTVKDAGESLGISNLSDEVARTLAMDIEYRIHEVVEQALKFMRHSKRATLNTEDISSALRVLNVEPLYGYDTGRPLKFREALVGPGHTLYYVDEEDEIDFDELINEPIPKVPREPTFTSHWLAIEGVQPAIPQNPHVMEIKALPPQIAGSQVNHSSASLTSDVEIKPLVKHMISKELQLYFERIVKVLVEDDSEDRQTALFSLRNDPGLHQLTPYFVQFAQEKVSTNLKSNLQALVTMLDVIDALLTNQNIFVEPYIHQIVPCVLTVLVARRVGPANEQGEEEPQSLEVREYAASLIRKLVSQYSDAYYTLKPRLTRTLLKGFLDVGRPLYSFYGIIVGIAALGNEVVRVIIVGNLKAWWDPVLESLQAAENPAAAEKVKEVLFKTLSNLSDGSGIDEGVLAEKIGEKAAKALIEAGAGSGI